MLNKFLCLVIDTLTDDEIAEYQVDAMDDWRAKVMAKGLFERDQKYTPRLRQYNDWQIDACQIDDS